MAGKKKYGSTKHPSQDWKSTCIALPKMIHVDRLNTSFLASDQKDVEKWRFIYNDAKEKSN